MGDSAWRVSKSNNSGSILELIKGGRNEVLAAGGAVN